MGRKKKKVNLVRYQKQRFRYWEHYVKFFGIYCLICREAFEINENGRYVFCVDHDHKTEKVRGLLCNHCNVFLGFLEKCGPELVEQAFGYLEMDRQKLWSMLKRVRVDLPHGLIVPPWKIQDARDTACAEAFQEIFQLRESPEKDGE